MHLEKIFNSVSVVSGIIGGGAAYWLGGWDTLLWTLLTFIILDYVTGVIKGIYQKNLSSEISFRGLLKKVVIIIMVVVANSLQKLLGDSVPLREIVIVFYIANEGISLLENSAVLLPDMPEGLKNVLLSLRDKGK